MRLTDRGLIVVYTLTVAAAIALVWYTRDTCWDPGTGWYGSCRAMMTGGN